MARHCQRAEERIVGGEERSKAAEKNRNRCLDISVNLARAKTTRVYARRCLGSLSDADILDCDNLSASGPSCYCFSGRFFFFLFEDDEWYDRVSINFIGQ